jgi:glycosyltransferase involved in cell wall biosynthesis
MKFPAYYIRHHSKVLWLLHQFRQAYDLWGTPYASLPDTPQGRRIRELIARGDNAYLVEAERIYSISETTRARLRSFNDLDAEVLYPPVIAPERYGSEEYGDYVFSPSRISPGKRQELLVRALAETSSDVRLVLAGSPDAPEHLRSLERLIEELDVAERVELHAGWISEEQKRELFAGALACAYVPYDEDSYGYVSLEAFHSRKPVITCTDSGGTLELIEHRRSGLVVEPEAPALAAAMDELREDPTLATRLGEAAFARIGELEISWDRVVERLLA